MRSLHPFVLAVVFVSASVVACSSSTTDSTDHSQHGGDAGADASGDDTEAGSNDAGSDTGPSTSLKAPTITMVAKMTGGLHVMWTNNQADCDAIEGERKSATDAYKVVFTVPDGTVDNKHDAPLTAGTTYTYRLRCKKGSDYSPYSNEKSGTP